jgi:hypothetical protein
VSLIQNKVNLEGLKRFLGSGNVEERNELCVAWRIANFSESVNLESILCLHLFVGMFNPESMKSNLIFLSIVFVGWPSTT